MWVFEKLDGVFEKLGRMFVITQPMLSQTAMLQNWSNIQLNEMVPTLNPCNNFVKLCVCYNICTSFGQNLETVIGFHR